MPKSKIGITGWGSISPLGYEEHQIWKSYQSGRTAIRKIADSTWQAPLEPLGEKAIVDLKQEQRPYRHLDRSVLLSMFAAKEATEKAAWEKGVTFGINIGASRGATSLWESHFTQFQEDAPNLSPQASPSTTLGNIASWTAHHLQNEGLAIEHSITCSTGLQAIANAVAWLESGRYERFLAGATESPLTPFTIAQMQALRIYSNETGPYPCRPLDFSKTANTMVLGEGSACFCLERSPENAKAYILGLGFGRESLRSATSIRSDGWCLQESMRRALLDAQLGTVDVIICHAPGTIKGDEAEMHAIREIFGESHPALVSNKWLLGHCLGASGCLSIELGLLMLQKGQIINSPFIEENTNKMPQPKTVMVNAVGFGGQAISVIIAS